MTEFPKRDEFEKSDNDLMQQFVLALHDLLVALVQPEFDRHGRLIFIKELRELISPALEESHDHFDRLVSQIPKIRSERILDHALKGDSLRFKLSVTRHWYDRFVSSPTPGLLRRLLDALEGLLDSIIDAAGTGGAIKELKEAIRNSTK